MALVSLAHADDVFANRTFEFFSFYAPYLALALEAHGDFTDICFVDEFEPCAGWLSATYTGTGDKSVPRDFVMNTENGFHMHSPLAPAAPDPVVIEDDSDWEPEDEHYLMFGPSD